MLPNNVLSTYTLPSKAIWGRDSPYSLTVRHEIGPIALQDPSEGLMYQLWNGQLMRDGIYISADNVPIYKILSLINVVEFDFTFDQNGNISIVYYQYGKTYLYWYDTLVLGMVTTDFGSGFSSPKIILDDKRIQFRSTSDLIFGYVRDGNLCYRQQRDRFGTEYVLKSGLGLVRLEHLAMGKNYRLQFYVRSL